MHLRPDKRGGARPRAGRPKGDSKLYAFRCPGNITALIDAQPNKTEFIRDSITSVLLSKQAALANLGDIIPAANVGTRHLPFFDQRVVAGFPVPLDSYDYQTLEFRTMMENAQKEFNSRKD